MVSGQLVVAKVMTTSEVLGRITNYLSAGGLFNPEMMEHDDRWKEQGWLK